MTLSELYTAIGGDYDGVLSRLMNSEKMVQKFVLKFLNDKSYDSLLQSMAAADYKEAFRAAHTIKGVGQNLGFTALYQSAGILTEAHRPMPLWIRSVPTTRRLPRRFGLFRTPWMLRERPMTMFSSEEVRPDAW